jgi:gamma-D-glutamyl-L-lysine dipeptidyl-peptidase
VATLWVAPGMARAVDRPALGNPADPRRWIASMSTDEKRWLVGKLETQALYGTRVLVTARTGPWLHVVVPSQATNRDRRGYPGWVPASQLTSDRLARSPRFAVVRNPTAWVYSGFDANGPRGARLMELSFDTALPVSRVNAKSVEVNLIGGLHASLARSDVTLRAAGAQPRATGPGLVAIARRFLGLSYLWAGTSGFGFDCSGFTYAIYAQFGLDLSRDAEQQAVHGTPVSTSALAAGDLVFFRAQPGGAVIHVAMYVGRGEIIEAPATGFRVREAPLWFGPDYAGARRYLNS